MVMPRAFTSGALSIRSYAVNVAPPVSARTFVIAAVFDVLPWSTWPIVPMLQSGLIRSKLAFAIVSIPLFFEPTFRWGRQFLFQHFRLAEVGAGEGNRTLVISLEGFCSTIELHPQTIAGPRGPAAAASGVGGGGRIRTFVDV